MRYPLLLATFLCVTFACATPAGSAETPGRRTIAVLGIDAGASTETVDGVVGALARAPGVTLVERQLLDRVVDEQVVAKLDRDAAARADAGRLVGADVLVMVGRAAGAGGQAVRLLVCDSATGARLTQLTVPAKEASAESLAREVLATLARFPSGVTSVVAVPDWIGRDLRPDHAHLQTGLADLLRDGLAAQPGVAVVEVDEAKSVAQEAERTGGQVRRLVPLYAEGEYRTDDLAAGGPKVTISVSLRTTGQELGKVESGPIPLDEAGPFVAGRVRQALLDALKVRPAEPFSARREFDRLVARADQFAEIGEFARSADLREAALLVRPDADAQRVRLVSDYARHNHQPVGVWPKGHRQTMDDPYWAAVVAHSRRTWRRSLEHVEYLVRNRRVDLATGTRLFGDVIHSITGIRMTTSELLGEEERIKKQFVRNVAPALLQLDSGKGNRADERQTAAYRVYENAFLRMDGNFLKPEDLTFVGDLLCDLLPEDTPVAAVMLYRLGDGTRMFGGSDRDVSGEDWKRFAERLAASPRPLVRAYGRYALLADRRYRAGERSDAVLAEAKSLLASLREKELADLDVGGYLRQAASDEAVRTEMALRPKPPPAPVAAARPELPTQRPLEQADGSLLCERVRLKPVTFAVERPGEKPQPVNGQQWRAAGGFAGWVGIVPAWPGVDVVYSHGALLILKPDGVAREILADPKLSIYSVVFDGRYLWASGGYDNGVYAFTPDGKVAAHVTAEHGLPGAYVEMPLHALSEGLVMAAGSIGQTGRSWLSTVDLRAGNPRVNVFHEAIKAWDYQDEKRRFEQTMDPAKRFRPSWIVGHTDAGGKRRAFVGRDNVHVPLVVDVETLAVSVYPVRKLSDEEYFPRSEPPPAAFHSQGGLLYVAGGLGDFKVFRLDEQTGRFREAVKRPDRGWHMGNLAEGCLAVQEGYLYYAGTGRWLRHHLETGRDEVLVANARSLPDYGAGGGWRVCVSNTFGLVAWYHGKLYQVSVVPAPDR